ncbi:ribonuclease P protein component [Porphyromonas sp. COT-239 OH1446]|uniref:ribonuclease P protein component n=1 Tax=Porphyromonas sp. COT-239 OH1446 TaxID=1515613 RepID=UPI00052D990C|nr:ribonuclease P protein component [Porphyromonas sp. COT-239 OH1446]KGN70183.1 hypothetical protein HQ37_03815 [Porphyromonas sp. COT-239 OH1446]
MYSDPPQPSQTFPKQERLCLKRDVQRLFASGESFIAYPLRVVYLLESQQQGAQAQVLVSVGKKYFRRANKRNRVKRLIREAYRRNKASFIAHLSQQNLHGYLGFMCVSKELPTYNDVERAIHKALGRIIQRHQPSPCPPPQS